MLNMIVPINKLTQLFLYQFCNNHRLFSMQYYIQIALCHNNVIVIMQLQVSTKTNENQLQISIAYPSSPQLQHNFTLTISLHEQNISNRTQSLTYKKVFHIQQRQILIQDLKYSTMYKLIVSHKYGFASNMAQNSKNIFVYTPAQRHQQQNDLQSSNQPYQESASRYSRRNQSIQQNRRQLANERNESSQNINVKTLAKTRPKKKIVHNNNQLCNSELLVKTLAQSNHIVNKNMAHKYMLESRKCRNVAEFINERHGKRINRQEVSDKRMLVIQSKLLFSEIYKYREGCKLFQNNWCMGPFYSFDANQREIRRH